MAFLNQAPLGYISTDFDGKIIGMNDTLLDWLGFKKEELGAHLHLYDFLTIGSKIYCETHLFPMFQMHGSAREINLELIRKNRTTFPVLLNAEQLKRSGGEKLLQMILIDITHRKLYEKELLLAKKSAEQHREELKQINEELAAFAHTVAHDLKSPVNNILGLIGLIKSKNEPLIDAESVYYLDLVTQLGEKMNRFIAELLIFASSGRAEIPMEEVSLNKILEEVKINLFGSMRENEATLFIPEEPFAVIGNSLELSRLFQNLIENALKYRHPIRSPEIKISIIPEEETILIGIQDNGLGIPPQYLHSIFNTFTRVNSNSKQTGSGIGLATCKKITERHQGTIWVESEVGEGSTFLIRLPQPDYFKENFQATPGAA
jgi:PAS domain S-box-containing protein